MIDHTLLKSTATQNDIKKLCGEAVKYGFYSVCINPCYVKLAKEQLVNTGVRVCTVVGFPLGANTTGQKINEAVEAVQAGASEIDMVAQLGAIKDANWEYVKREIETVKRSLEKEAVLKVIVESALLTEEELKKVSFIAIEAGADFVKTSTGFADGGATVEAVSLIRSVVGPDKGVKASGGIRTLSQAVEMIKAGANRLGCSSGVKIMLEME
jgi:deoxyribose-phosphate aldolase